MKAKSSRADPTVQCILLDAYVLINFIRVEQLDLFSKLKRYKFFVPEHVVSEIKQQDQAASLKQTIENGTLEQTVITDIKEMVAYAEFHKKLGQGESACLAIALNRGHFIASDEKGLFRRIVIEKIGQRRLVTTPHLILSAMHAKLITAIQADKWKTRLEIQHRFKMEFRSFKEFL